MPSEAAIAQIWTASLLIYGAVVAVVALLLTRILLAARRIHRTAAAIWTMGQRVANNTIHTALLVQTNHLVAQIRQSAGEVAAAARALERHAAVCPHCPSCVAGPVSGGGR